MRRALDNYLPITTVHGQAGYGHFGKHAGYDYGVVKQPVKAPEAGTITAVYLGRENVDGGNIVELRSGKYDHRFLHLDSAKVKVGQKVTEGQVLGVSGNTGKVGYHLHHDVRTKGTAWTDSYANYVDWEKLIKPVAPPQGGNMYQGQTAQYWWKKNEARRVRILELEAALKTANDLSARRRSRILELEAQIGQSSEANLLGQALIKMLTTFGWKKG
jgi:hypothetical protein